MNASLLTALFLVVAVAYVQGAATPKVGLKEKVQAIAKKCAEESKVSADKAKIVFSQDIPKTDSEKCFLECVYKNVGVVENDKFSHAGTTKLVHVRFQKPEEITAATKLVEACNKEVSAKKGEKCSLGRAIRECFVNHGKQVNFFPSAA